jgi:hypothetical protein
MLVITATELPRVMQCNGSRLMPASLPPQATDPTDREEGNAAHWAAQRLFEGHDIVPGQFAPNGYAVTGEMLEHVGTYLSALNCGEMETETSFGTDVYRVNARCDHRKWDAPRSTLHIDDFKYGRRLVDPVNNWTLIAHAIGTCMFLQIRPERIVLTIHQPRPHHPDGHSRSWVITYTELMNLYSTLDATLRNPSDMLRTGSQCAKCHALATCPAAREAGMNAIDATCLAFNENLSNDIVSFELDTLRTAAATIKNRLTALEDLAQHRLRGGQIIDNYALDNQWGHRRWKPGLTAKAVSLVTGVDVTKDELVTPAEAERRGVPAPVVKSLTERPMTGVKLIRQSADQRARKLLNTRS